MPPKKGQTGFVAVLVASALVACGGKDEGRPELTRGGATEPLDQCERAEEYEFLPIVDFEGEPRMQAGYPAPVTLAACNPDVSCAANGQFYVNFAAAQSTPDPSDPSLGDQCVRVTRPEPPPEIRPFGNMLYASEIPGERCESSNFALNVFARNIATCYGSNGRLGWGASIDISFGPSRAADAGADGAGAAGAGAVDDEPGATGFDASAWDGIAFWVKYNGVGGRSMIMTVADPGTTPPNCSTEETAQDSEKCDAFGIAVTVTDDWTLVAAPFEAMHQKGFGRPSPLGQVEPGNIAKIQFLIGPGDWDFWIDDVSFFRTRR